VLLFVLYLLMVILIGGVDDVELLPASERVALTIIMYSLFLLL
jgi:hypothetical protein